MKTMYRIDEHRYIDMERGLGTRWEMGKTYYDTAAEAEANHIVKKSYVSDGSYKVVERTMDEATFTITETVVKHFDYWKEVAQKEVAQRRIKAGRERLARLEANLKNAKTELGLARKLKEIENQKAEVEEWEKVLAEL